jgi:hypothetical protein
MIIVPKVTIVKQYLFESNYFKKKINFLEYIRAKP